MVLSNKLNKMSVAAHDSLVLRLSCYRGWDTDINEIFIFWDYTKELFGLRGKTCELDGIYSYECDSVEGVMNYLRCVFQDRFPKGFYLSLLSFENLPKKLYNITYETFYDLPIKARIVDAEAPNSSDLKMYLNVLMEVYSEWKL